MRGIISFCDILGYQSFLANNSATESALKVLDIITSAPKSVKSRFDETWSSLVYTNEITDALQHLVFSDTIVLMIPYPKEVDDEWRNKAFAYITAFTAYLKCKMFTDGLPLRCVIHEGDFITRETCLAGMAIIDAYRLAESLDLSALVLSPTLSQRLIKEKKIDTLGGTFIEYLTPMKNLTETKLIHYNWLRNMNSLDIVDCSKDVDTFVLKSFWAHQKDCSNAVDNKVKATIKIIRKMLIINNDKDYLLGTLESKSDS